MKRNYKANIFLLLSASVFLLTGCAIHKSIPIVTLNDTILYKEDFLYDIFTVEEEGNQLEESYQDKLGCSYWNYEIEGTTMREAAKSSILTRVVMYEILSDQATQKGFSLTKEEMSADGNSVDDFIHKYSEVELSKYGLTRELLLRIFHKKSLGDKYYKALSKNFIIDEAKIRKQIDPKYYREYKTDCLLIPTVSIDHKKITPYNESEKAVAYNTINEVLKKLENGKDFADLLNEYDDLSYATRDFIMEDKIFEEEYKKAALLLKNGEYSKIVSTENGYYIIHMLDNNSTDRYEKAFEEAVQSEEDTQFKDVYNKMKDQYDISIDFDYWNSITIGSTKEE